MIVVGMNLKGSLIVACLDVTVVEEVTDTSGHVYTSAGHLVKYHVSCMPCSLGVSSSGETHEVTRVRSA